MRLLIAILLFVVNSAFALDSFPSDYQKKRVLISTDIGGGDPDDIQSMIHYLVYADMFDLEGIVISRPRGAKSTMLKVIRAYRKDYHHFRFVSADYPTPGQLRRLVKVGAERNKKTPSVGYSRSTPGSRLIVQQANKEDPRPLHILVWGAITDVAQAIHDSPKIKKKIRIFSITSPNNKGYNTELDPSPSLYLRRVHAKSLYWIESDDTFRGIYNTGMFNKTKYGNVGFVKQVIKPRGALGKLFYKVSANINVNSYGIKMGDTPSLLFLFNGNFDNPTKPSWGGQYCKVKKNYHVGCKKYEKPSVSRHKLDILKDWEKRLIRIYDKK